ncbi:TPA: hypothetical protein JAZ42_15660 [Legionella pneumophila]|nr:hypothetical protein [Legionella pneumophila]HAT7770445.1 hypothetical protein [Legionella pneumophila]HAU1685296.1 hypothetical protein [Legionella pneumophila]HAU1718777.1 hypothetical protein [Legionella pneumophila]
MLFDADTPEDVLFEIFRKLPPAKLMLFISAAKKPLKAHRAALNALWSLEGGEAEEFQHKLLKFGRRFPSACRPDRKNVFLRLINAPYAIKLAGLDWLLSPSQREQANHRVKLHALLPKIETQENIRTLKKFAWVLTIEQRDELIKTIMTPKYEGEHFTPRAPEMLYGIAPYLNSTQLNLFITPLLEHMISSKEDLRFTALSLIKILAPHFSVAQFANFWQPMLDSLAHKDFRIRMTAVKTFLCLVPCLTSKQLSECIPVILNGIMEDDIFIFESASTILMSVAAQLNYEQLSIFIEPTVKRLTHRNLLICNLSREILKAIVPYLSSKQRADLMQRVLNSHGDASGNIPIRIIALLIDLAYYLNPDQLKEFMAPLAGYLASDFKVSVHQLISYPNIVPYLGVENLGLLLISLKDKLTYTDGIGGGHVALLLKQIGPHVSPEKLNPLIKPILTGLASDDIHIHFSMLAILRILIPYFGAKQVEVFIPYILQNLIHVNFNERDMARNLFVILAPYLREHCHQQPDVFVQPVLDRLGRHSRDVDNGLKILIEIMPYLNSAQTKTFLPSVLTNIAHESDEIKCYALEAFAAIKEPISSELLNPFIAPILNGFNRHYYVREASLKAFGFLLPRLNHEQLNTVAQSLYNDLMDIQDLYRPARIEALHILTPYLSPEQFEPFILPLLNDLGSGDKSIQHDASKVLYAFSHRLTSQQLMSVIPRVLDRAIKPIMEQWTKFPQQVIGQTQKDAELTDNEKGLLKFFIGIMRTPESSEIKRNLALQILSSWMIGLLVKREQGCNKMDEGLKFLDEMFEGMEEVSREFSMMNIMRDLCSVSVSPVHDIKNSADDSVGFSCRLGQ